MVGPPLAFLKKSKGVSLSVWCQEFVPVERKVPDGCRAPREAVPVFSQLFGGCLGFSFNYVLFPLDVQEPQPLSKRRGFLLLFSRVMVGVCPHPYCAWWVPPWVMILVWYPFSRVAVSLSIKVQLCSCLKLCFPLMKASALAIFFEFKSVPSQWPQADQARQKLPWVGRKCAAVWGVGRLVPPWFSLHPCCGKLSFIGYDETGAFISGQSREAWSLSSAWFFDSGWQERC